jgi:hypothetical protein
MGAYNSGKPAICKILSKALRISLSVSTTALTKSQSSTTSLLGCVLALTKSNAVTTPGFNFVNQLTTFQALFGLGSYQSNSSITIKKAELPNLTSSLNNSAESLVVALLLLWAAYTKGKIDGKVSVNRWGVYFADGKVRYILEVNFYRQFVVISNEIQEISDPLVPSSFS